MLLAAAPGGAARAETYTFAVQPILSPQHTRAVFEPLADYLGERIGEPVVLLTAVNFVAYWEMMKKGRYDLLLDAAHFTDFRIKRMGYRVLARVPDTVSLTLVTGGDLLVFEPEELIGRRLATLGSPSMPAVRANQLFPNPIRLPVMVDYANSDAAIKALLTGQVASALIPSPLVGNFPDLNTVLTTDPIPHIAMSASPRVPAAVAERIRAALLDMENSTAGRRALDAIRLPPFVPASAETYDGYSRLLDGVWGY